MQNNRICTVCNIPITEIYCHTCGQKMKKEITTVKSICTDFMQNLFSLDKSVFATIYKLLTNPRKIISNYSSGYRRYYPSPGKLLVYAMTIAAIHLTFINDNILGLTFDLDGVKGHFLFWIFFFPLLTLTSILAFFRLKLGVAKHLITTAYIASCFFIIITVINAVFIKLDMDLHLIPFCIFLIAVFIWNATVHTPKPKIRVLFYTLIQLFFFALIVLAIMGIIYLISPDSVHFK